MKRRASKVLAILMVVVLAVSSFGGMSASADIYTGLADWAKQLAGGDSAVTAPADGFVITWKNGKEVIYTSTVAADEKVEYNELAYGTPTKKDSTLYTYEFVGWNTDPNAQVGLRLNYVKKDTTYYAIFQAISKAQYYNVNWVNRKATMHSEKVLAGGVSSYDLSAERVPMKECDAEYSYTFIGWNTDPNATKPLALKLVGKTYYSEAVTKDTTYYAIFAKTKIDPDLSKFSVKWMNGEKVLHDDPYQISDGNRAIYIIEFNGRPQKTSENPDYIYEFIGWNTDPNATKALPLTLSNGCYFSLPIHEDTVYYAIFKKVATDPNKFTVRWFNDDTLLHIDPNQISYGNHALYPIEDYGIPTKAADKQYSYKFIGWNTDPNATKVLNMEIYQDCYISPRIVADTDFYAIYEKTPVEYTITWIVDGKKTEEIYHYGDMPTFKGSTDKASTATEYYSFSGWDKKIVPVTADATYTAQYKVNGTTSPKTGDMGGALWMALSFLFAVVAFVLMMVKKTFCKITGKTFSK